MSAPWPFAAASVDSGRRGCKAYPVGVLGFGFVELWVGNARQAAAFFSSSFGFSATGLAGPDIGADDRVSYVLRQGAITLVLTGATTPDSPVARYVLAHGDGVRDIALVVDDPAKCFQRAVDGGAPGLPAGSATESRSRPKIGTFGDTVHSLVGADDPLVDPKVGEVSRSERPVGLVDLDHYAVSVDPGGCARWTAHYAGVLGFERGTRDEHVEVDGSAFNMSTARAPGGSAVFVFAEPAPSLGKSQISHFLEEFGGPGVHHIAFATADIASTVSALRARGITILDVGPEYYRNAEARLKGVDVDWRKLAELGVMVDVEDDGYLLQAFTQPLGDRPTTYLEIIQREGTSGFGARNVQDLYSTVVREQERIDSGRV